MRWYNWGKIVGLVSLIAFGVMVTIWKISDVHFSDLQGWLIIIGFSLSIAFGIISSTWGWLEAK